MEWGNKPIMFDAVSIRCISRCTGGEDKAMRMMLATASTWLFFDNTIPFYWRFVSMNAVVKTFRMCAMPRNLNPWTAGWREMAAWVVVWRVKEQRHAEAKLQPCSSPSRFFSSPYQPFPTPPRVFLSFFPHTWDECTARCAHQLARASGIASRCLRSAAPMFVNTLWNSHVAPGEQWETMSARLIL